MHFVLVMLFYETKARAYDMIQMKRALGRKFKLANGTLAKINNIMKSGLAACTAA